MARTCSRISAPPSALTASAPAASEAFGVGDGVCDGVVTVIRQVRGQQGARLGPGGGADVMLHLGHGDMRRVRIAQHHHAQRIADQNQRNAGLIEQACHRKIIGGERGNLLAARFHGADGFQRSHLVPVMVQPSRRSGTRQAETALAGYRLKLASNSSGVMVAVPILPTTMPAA